MADKPKFQSTQSILGLKPRTTASGSAKIRNWNEEIKKQALFSARTTRKAYLDDLKKKLAAIASRDVIPEVAVKQLQASLAEMGYKPSTGFPGDISKWHGATIPPAVPGSITDLSSQRRINLIIDTNIKQAQSMGQISTSENPVFLMANPAWELKRVGSRKKPRADWQERWNAAGDSVGWKGALKNFVALKDSPIWAALGDGNGGYNDTLGADYPPYAFGSGMGWVNVGRKAWKEMCDKAGVPDQLESIVEKARALKRAQEAVGGEGAYGASANKDWKQNAQEEALMKPEEQVKPVFHPDTSGKDRVVGIIGEVKDFAEKVKNKVLGIEELIIETKKRLTKIENENPDIDLSVVEAEIEKQNDLADKYWGGVVFDANLQIIKSRDSLDGILVPSNEEEQAGYDLEVKKVEENIGSIKKDLVDIDSATDSLKEAVQKTGKDLDGYVIKLKKEACEKIVNEAKLLIDALTNDDFERIKEKFTEAKKEAKRRRSK